MARLEDEFRNIIISHASPVETETLTELMSSNHLTPRTSTSISEFPGNEDYSSRDVCFKKLRVEKLSTSYFQRMEWEALNTKIGTWMCATKMCVRVLFAREKRLFEHIFEGLGTATNDACFMETVKAESFRVQAMEILSRLAEAARGMINEFENAILREASKFPFPGGTIDP
ncbi:unnamed protein product [Lactuca saligna]|uniref:Exocyst subunit Exo70 family protein n=1 Tax=Lactuca saligna TaxID=75948 RepID=A0AA36EDX8_LACSI|nr:unnamed protein product [Lactuca saligna]